MPMDAAMRIGQGYDCHRLAAGRRLVLGGVEIDGGADGLGLLGHSDADVLLHAVIDAVLGSVAAGDIGGHFSDRDPQWKGADSRELLRRVLALPALRGWRLVNLDCTVIAEAPRLAPHIAAIRASLAALFGCGVEAVSVKAKTNEGLDAVGARQAIQATAVLLAEISPQNTQSTQSTQSTQNTQRGNA